MLKTNAVSCCTSVEPGYAARKQCLQDTLWILLGKNLIKSFVLRSVCWAARAFPAFSSLGVTDKCDDADDGHVMLVDSLSILTVARVDMLWERCEMEPHSGIIGSTVLTNKWDSNICLAKKQLNEDFDYWTSIRTQPVKVRSLEIPRKTQKKHPEPQKSRATVWPRQAREHGTYRGETVRGNEAEVEHVLLVSRKKRRRQAGTRQTKELSLINT